MAETRELQVILSSGEITGIKLNATAAGNAVLTFDEVYIAPTTVNAATYDVLTTDSILHVTYTATGTVAITIPTALILTSFRLTIKDAGGNASANNITINAEGGELFDGSATAVINSDYSAINLYSDGTNLFIY
jgi:hypothetical protein